MDVSESSREITGTRVCAKKICGKISSVSGALTSTFQSFFVSKSAAEEKFTTDTAMIILKVKKNVINNL